MFFSSLFERVRWDGARSEAGRPSRPSASRCRVRPRRRNLPRLEMLEDRTVPSGGYLFRTFDIPGASSAAFQGTVGNDINNLGQVVGVFTDATSHAHGFLGAGDQLTTIDDPNAAPGQPPFGTSTNGLNDSGQIVGDYGDASGTFHGFLLQGDQFTTLDDPNAGTGLLSGTIADEINNPGQVVGVFVDPSGQNHGFLLQGGQYSTIDDPSAATGSELGTLTAGINNNGQIVGQYLDANPYSTASCFQTVSLPPWMTPTPAPEGFWAVCP